VAKAYNTEDKNDIEMIEWSFLCPNGSGLLRELRDKGLFWIVEHSKALKISPVGPEAGNRPHGSYPKKVQKDSP
jgi:hypothetical protein